MFHRHRWLDFFLTLIFVGTFGCSGLGGGCGCDMQPLPGGALPADQTIEGGAQVRVTPSGFDKLTSIIPPVINDAVSDGFCVGQINQGIGVADLEICDTNDGMCTNGCQVDVFVDYINMSVPDDDTFRISTQFDVDTDVHVSAYDPLFGFSLGSCTFDVTLTDGQVTADIGFGIDPADGELTIQLQNIDDLDISNLNLNGCGVLGDILGAVVDFVADVLSSEIAGFLIDLLTPLLDDLIQGFLPDPLGIEGIIDAGALMSGISPGTNALLEVRGVPGGYVQLSGGGLSLGIITGLNADEDISTRTPDLDSEPAFCVPPKPAPDFAAPPASLPTSARSTFILAGAEEFMGAPDPAAELAIGLSETTLDLGGHHAFTSGALCLGIGTSLIEQLNLGTIGILVPSLSELGNDDGKDPLLLVTRPQKAIDFTIGEGTETDPALTIHMEDFEVDFYAFLFERYTRGFSMRLTLDVGVNLEFTTDMNGAPAVLPTLVGLSADNIELTVLNSEFLRESPEELQDVLPAIFDLALPLIADGLGEITLPEFAGFTLSDLSLTKVTTSEDDFLAIYASLGASQQMSALAEIYPSLRPVLDAQFVVDEAPVRAGGKARLLDVVTPTPAVVRAGLAKAEGGALPEVTIDVDTIDAQGRQLEWSWNLNGGMWRPFEQADPLVIRDRAFAFQGRYQIGLRSRVVGEYRTTQLEPQYVDAVIDSVGPRILTHRAGVKNGVLEVPALDLVSPPEGVTVAFGRTAAAGGTEQPERWTDFGDGRIDANEATRIAGDGLLLQVWARDELGNESTAVVDLGPIVGFHGSGGEGGCDCSSAGDASSQAGLALLAGLTLLFLGGLRRPRRVLRRVAGSRTARRALMMLPYAALIAGMSALPACSCGATPGEDVACEIDDDCAGLCPDNQIPFCFDNKCVCADDVPYGRIGQYSDLDLSTNGTAWVSAYNSSHGDLMVAPHTGDGRIPNESWSFVDGVPDGPVVLPESDIRGGIFDKGPDVGKYTSIAVAPPNDTVMASYFDVDEASLKFASFDGTNWTTHVVDDGRAGGDPELGYEIVGQYSSITTRSDDGRPGIAYFAHVSEGGENVRTEVRYASAQTATPTGPADWNVWVVDSAAVAPPDGTDPFPIPPGVGLFITSARLSDQAPVVVYYDRINGDLKMAKFDSLTGAFLEPQILDGEGSLDVGWYPSVAVDSQDNLHVSYVNATHDDLYYINTIDMTPQVVDDGYRIVGTTEDGLPKPEFHFVGDDSSIVLTTAGPVIVYQDATTHELLIGQKDGESLWQYETVAGDEEPFEGGYGFYAAADYDGQDVVMSTWVVDQPTNTVWVEIFRRTVVIE